MGDLLILQLYFVVFLLSSSLYSIKCCIVSLDKCNIICFLEGVAMPIASASSGPAEAMALLVIAAHG